MEGEFIIGLIGMLIVITVGIVFYILFRIYKKLYLNLRNTNLHIKAYNDLASFKIFMNDIGLLRRMAKLDSSIILEGNKLFEEFKGALTENYVLQQIKALYYTEPKYYAPTSTNEIDFIVQDGTNIIPIEAKAGI